MRKLLFLLFAAFAAFAILNCSADDDMPCMSCKHDPYPSQGGGYFPQNQYAYCLIRDSYYGYYECEYMSVYDCDYDYGGETYSDDYTCGDYWWQSSNPQPPPSSSSRPVSSSSVEYTGGSCNVNDYGRVEIGGQVWMAKNWGCYAAGSKCYNNDPANCNTYGRLYDWATAMNIDSRYNSEYWNRDVNHRGICPSGWHIPNNDDWSELVSYVENYWGCSSCAARYLKSQYGWNSGGNGEDTFGFSALPGGSGYSDGGFSYVGYNGFWWSASETNSITACDRGMGYIYEYVYWDDNGKDYLFSVRCLQD